jgi:heterodisulfide reductase subunit C
MKEGSGLKEEIKRISGTDSGKCMKCGKCSASCVAVEQMDVSPHMFVKHVEEGNIEYLKEVDTLWKCLSCFACVERCPRGVKPANLVEAVRLSVIRQQHGNYIEPEDIPEQVEQDAEIPQQLIMSVFRKYAK